MTRILAIAIFALSLFGASGAVLAQGNYQQGQLQRELDRTDELIVQAREAVRISNSAIAAQALNRAEAIQEQARQQYNSHNTQGYVASLSFTKKAREQAGLAISYSRLSEQLEGVVQGRLEKAREMIDRARESLPTPPGPIAETLLERARNSLAQAGEFYHQKRYKATIKVVEQVEQIVNRLRSMSRLANQAGQTFQHRIENVERLIEYADELLADCGSERGLEILRHAKESVQRARQFEIGGRPRAALMALEQARKSARKAARECQDGDLLQRRLGRLRSEYDRAAARLTEYDGDNREAARTLLDQAREQLEQAQHQLTEDKVEPAQLSLQAAQLALRQTLRYLGGRM